MFKVISAAAKSLAGCITLGIRIQTAVLGYELESGGAVRVLKRVARTTGGREALLLYEIAHAVKRWLGP